MARRWSAGRSTPMDNQGVYYNTCGRAAQRLRGKLKETGASAPSCRWPMWLRRGFGPPSCLRAIEEASPAQGCSCRGA
ncbi:MAG: hypothetical protein ACLSDQ_07265 [Adlercreutzia equolifaciens]